MVRRDSARRHLPFAILLVAGLLVASCSHDDGTLPALEVAWLVDAVSVGEADGSVTLTATLNRTSGSDVTVPFTMNPAGTASGAGADYDTPAAAQVVITAGTLAADLVITINDDTEDENPETIIVDMGVPTGAVPGSITTVTVTIADDEEPYFFIEPAWVPNSADVTILIHADGVTGVSVVAASGPGGVMQTFAASFDAAHGRIEATVPAALAAGNWSLTITDQNGIVNSVANAFQVTDDTRLALESVSPAYVPDAVPTDIALALVDPIPGGSVGFAAIPRVYVVPSVGGTAMELRSVWLDGNVLRAITPPGLTVGVCDVTVVNPDGTGVTLPGALTVYPGAPPVITGVTPNVLMALTPTSIAISGSGFEVGAAVEIECVSASDGSVTVHQATAVTVVDASNVDANTPASIFEPGTCVVRLANPSGGVAEFGPIANSTPAFSLSGWSAAGAMNIARAAHGLAGARVSDDLYCMYAIGGDDGSPTNMTSSVESVALDRHGVPSIWKLRRSLPGARAYVAAASIARFIYVVGGHDGISATQDVYRAQVLDPDGAPRITDFALVAGSAGTPGPGRWHYVVSAVYPAGDASNPGGESLPSNAYMVEVPGAAGVAVRIEWGEDTAAEVYNVYRSSAPDAGPSDLLLITTVPAPATSYLDDDTDTGSPSTPLEPGDLGEWHAVFSLNTAREGLSVLAAPDPVTAQQFHLYAIGGRNDVGTYLATYEYATVTVDVSGSQVVSAWTDGSSAFAVPRADTAAWVVTSKESSNVPPGAAYVYIGPGATSAAAEDNSVDAGLVAAGGDLGVFSPVSSPPARAGAAHFVIDGNLVITGGRPLNGGSRSAEVQFPPPATSNWNALGGGGTLIEARSYASGLSLGGVLLIVGGFDGTGVLYSVERTTR